MTWTELHAVLVARGLVRGDHGIPTDGAAGFVTGIAYDSRAVEPGNVFVALKGLRADGSQFAQHALDRGAVAVVSEETPPPQVGSPWTVVADARLALACLAATFYQHPSAELRVVGITGTNGKTTTAYLVAAIFEAAGIRCGILGTVAYRIGAEVLEADATGTVTCFSLS